MNAANFQTAMADAARLTSAGDLAGATAAIQAALRGSSGAGGGVASAPTPGEIIDVEAREVDAEAVANDGPPPAAPVVDTDRFIDCHFANASDGRDYKLYIPAGGDASAKPLIVMLHGCSQDPADFAAGTAMNELAQSMGFYVLYPAQSAQANPQRCWNWFKHSHQRKARGEPALIAGMTRDVIARHPIDARRVYVAGLSAGGAMAAILGREFPDLYAAVGVHSGLAAGIASDLPSAMAAMQGNGSKPRGAAKRCVATIVFHGDADTTVKAINGEHIIAACVGDATRIVEATTAPDGARRGWTRRVHRRDDGRSVAEHWSVHGGTHGWSGGTRHGSFTDANGPDASGEMVRFFLEHPRTA